MLYHLSLSFASILLRDLLSELKGEKKYCTKPKVSSSNIIHLCCHKKTNVIEICIWYVNSMIPAREEAKSCISMDCEEGKIMFLCRFLGTPGSRWLFAKKNSSAGCRWRGWKLSSSAASFPGHRHVGDVTADLSWRWEIFNLDTDIYGAVNYNKVQRPCIVLFSNLNQYLNHKTRALTLNELLIPPEDLTAT